MSGLATHAKRFVGPLLANRWTGVIAARVLGDRIPDRRLTVDKPSRVVTPKIKAALLLQGYESGEYPIVRRYVPTDCDIIELGSGLGVISCTIRRRVDPARRQFIVEAGPRLAQALRRNVAINYCQANVEVIEMAIRCDSDKTMSFAMGERSVSGRVTPDAGSPPTIGVPARTLSQLIERHNLSNFASVSDIERVEWRILKNGLEALASARMIALEKYDSPGNCSHEDLIAALQATGRFDLIDRHGLVVILKRKNGLSPHAHAPRARTTCNRCHAPDPASRPPYHALATDPGIDLQVLYDMPLGAKSYFEKEMQSEISWNMDMLGDYRHEFLGEVPVNGQSSVWESSSPQIAARLKAFGFDVVLVYGHAQANVHRAICWCRRNKVPLMSIGDSELPRERAAATRMTKEIVVCQIFRCYSAFLSAGGCNTDFYVYYGAPRDHIFRWPSTVDETTYRAAKANRAALWAEARRTFDISDDAIVALFVGKLSTRKCRSI
ncbi:FkbM family methyltransferase [Sphingomonas mali]|uniref:FkbM family methyltransferase n=1 Tax=Sphingomonas mali TaxID=40682 RepID=UPI00082DD4F9|nr:FkbM family methyltransferase [Sphingomonas mali]